MSPVGQKPTQDRKRAVIKALVFAVFIIAAIVFVRFTSLKEFFTRTSLSRLLETAGVWAPLFFIVVYAVGVCLFVPGTLLTALGAAIFGPYQGFLFVWLGAMIGSIAAFWIGRTLGREFAAFYSDELRHGSDQGAVPGLFYGDGFGNYRGNIRFYFFHRNVERSVGRWRLG